MSMVTSHRTVRWVYNLERIGKEKHGRSDQPRSKSRKLTKMKSHLRKSIWHLHLAIGNQVRFNLPRLEAQHISRHRLRLRLHLRLRRRNRLLRFRPWTLSAAEEKMYFAS